MRLLAILLGVMAALALVASSFAGMNVYEYKDGDLGKVTFDDGHENEYKILKKTDDNKERYEKYVIKDGKLVGSILLGSKDNLSWLTQKIGKEITEKEIQDHFKW